MASDIIISVTEFGTYLLENGNVIAGVEYRASFDSKNIITDVGFKLLIKNGYHSHLLPLIKDMVVRANAEIKIMNKDYKGKTKETWNNRLSKELSQ